MKFTKMHGAGNDFLLINGFIYDEDEIIPKIKNLCDRRFGVGGDGLMIALPSETSHVKMAYFNSDGSRGEMCGNGLRCFSKFVYDEKLVTEDELSIETLAGEQYAILETHNGLVTSVEIEISNPKFLAESIPVLLEKNKVFNETLEIFGEEIKFSTIFLGVPHTVIFMNDRNQYDINKFGREIEIHPLFPNKTNVNFAYVTSKDEVEVYTWERGAGRTLACGTGASSVALIGYELGLLNKKARIVVEGGILETEVLDNGVKLVGGAETTFTGRLDLNSY